MRRRNKKNEIFEITDYTNSTEFEEFIYSVEQVIETWGISNGRSWNVSAFPEFSRSESLVYNAQSFRLTHSTVHVTGSFKPLLQAHFPSKTHCLNRWFGLSEFLILSPETTDDAIYFLDSSKLLLSSLACALTHTKCNIPMFLQLGSPSKRFYSGIWLNNSIQTTLEMVLLKSPPPQCSSLKEILCFYKRSIPCAVSPFPQTYLSIRYTFSLNNFVGCLKDDCVYAQDMSSISTLPFGSARDPIQDLLLATTWVGLSEHLISDTESGELDPLKASFWSMRSTNTSNPFCILYNYMDYVMSLLSNESTLFQLLGTSVDDSIEVDVSGAFKNLTNTPPLLQLPALDLTMLPGKLLGTYGALVNNDLLGSYMNYIFVEPYKETELSEHMKCSPIKSSPEDSITHRIVVVLCLVLCNHGGLKGFAQLWRCVVEQFRQCYETSKLIPGATAQPDTSFSLLHQKIQMLNACISQRIERESAVYTSTEGQDQSHKQNEHSTLKLLLTGESLCVPLTQCHPPRTEDMQEEHAVALAKLGSGTEGTRLRAQLHSISLSSDMQAFKAANPSSRLEDFIRWYSPRDWITVPITRPDNKELGDTINTDASQDEKTDQLQSSTEFDDLEHEEKMDCEKLLKTDEIQLDISNLDTTPTADSPENVTDIDIVASSHIQDEDSMSEVSTEDVKAEETPNKTSESDKQDDPEDGTPESGNEVSESDQLLNSTVYSDTTDDDDDALRSSQLSLADDEDEEFLDAEDIAFGDQSEMSDIGFKSASEASVNVENDALTEGNQIKIGNSVEDDEFALSHISGDFTESQCESEVNETDIPIVTTASETKPEASSPDIKYDEPLDPLVYGGHLTPRMSKESIWKEVWHFAQPIPIWHQKRLFDDTKEAERILHQFTYSRMRDIALLIIPTLIHAAYMRILLCPESSNDFIKEHIDTVYRKLQDLHRYSSNDTDLPKEILSDIYTIEILLSKFKSLHTKLTNNGATMSPSSGSTKPLTELERRTRRITRGPKLVSPPSHGIPDSIVNESELLQQLIKSEVELPGAVKSCWGTTIQRLFHAQQVAGSNLEANQPRQIVPIFPAPIGREYILQTVTRHPSSVSRECPQRMFVTISGTEFRMAYANSSDKSFF